MAKQEKASFDLGLGLERTHVMITGAAGQIGVVLVEAFLAAGANVTAIDIKSNSSPKANFIPMQVDVCEETEVAAAFERARFSFGGIDCLVHAAGKDLSFLEHHDLNTTMSLAQFRETMRVNVEGAFLVCREWLRELPNCHKSMRNRSLIVFGSEAGIWGVDNVDYATSKAALHGLVQSFAADAVRKGGRVNLIAPGLVDTPQYQKEITETPALAWEGLATVVQGAPVPVADVARTCLYLASDNYSGSITAQTIRVDSGRSGRLYWPDSSSIA